MSYALAKNVKLSFKMLGIEGSTLAYSPVTVVSAKDDEWLKDGGFLATSGRAQDSPIGGYFSPSENSQAEVVSDLGEYGLLALKLNWIGLEEDVTDCILACFR
jgi:hypothetical protein